jgi:hypothetical protein
VILLDLVHSRHMSRSRNRCDLRKTLRKERGDSVLDRRWRSLKRNAFLCCKVQFTIGPADGNLGPSPSPVREPPLVVLTGLPVAVCSDNRTTSTVPASESVRL